MDTDFDCENEGEILQLNKEMEALDRRLVEIERSIKETLEEMKEIERQEAC